MIDAQRVVIFDDEEAYCGRPACPCHAAPPGGIRTGINGWLGWPGYGPRPCCVACARVALIATAAPLCDQCGRVVIGQGVVIGQLFVPRHVLCAVR